jgi:hypothetical protein
MASSSTLRKLRPEDETPGVIPLRRSQLDTEVAPGYPDLDFVFREWTKSGSMLGDMKKAIEASVFDVLARHFADYQKLEDSAFDSIYLADLKPDPIAANDVVLIQRHADIKDLSETLVLQDGWDD